MFYFTFKAKNLLFGSLFAICLFLICFFAKTPSEVFKVGEREIPIYSVERQDNKIALTFNCAWNSDDIDQILALLKKYNADASFFVVGDWALKNPEALKKINDAGFEIGNHSYNHAHYSKLSKAQILEDIEKCDKIIEDITKTKPSLFRAAYGEYTNDVVTACDESGRKYIQWSVDSLDYKADSPQQIQTRVLEKTAPGDIILMHNGTEHTAKALETLLPSLVQKFTLTRVSDLIYHNNFTIDTSGRQHKTQD